MSSSREPKSATDRIQECALLLAQMRADPHIRISEQNPSLALLKKRMGAYWREGTLMEDRIPIQGTNRSFVYRFPRWADQYVELTLRVDRRVHRELPEALRAELLADAITPAAHPSDPPAAGAS